MFTNTCTMAERRRSLPALPKEITSPDACWEGSAQGLSPLHAMVGAIMDVSLSPGGRAKKPSGFRSSSPIMLFSMIPVPGTTMPEPDPQEEVTQTAIPAASTTHVSVVDAAGMAVSVTSSCGSGSGIVVPGTGIMLNNMMGEEDLNPDGFFALPPGERLTSMMAPTIACSGDRPWAEPSQQASGEVISLGSAGSERLRSAIVQVLVNMLDMGMDPQAAVDQPRLHLERGVVHLEPDHVEAVAACLEEEGYPVNRWPSPDLYFGGTQVAQGRYDHGRTEFKGGGDPRRGGASLCL